MKINAIVNDKREVVGKPVFKIPFLLQIYLPTDLTERLNMLLIMY